MDSFLDPEQVLENLSIRPGIKIADFGAAHGYYAIPLAQRVGEGGMVYAFDMQEPAVQALRAHAKSLHLSNLEVRRVDLEEPDATGLRDGLVDIVLLSNTLFQIQDKPAVIREAARILKPQGMLVVIDWQKDAAPLGPPLNLRVDKEELEKYFAQTQLKKIREFEAGAHHYGLIWEKP